MVASDNKDANKNKEKKEVDRSLLDGIANDTKGNIIDYGTISQMLSDIELAELIYTSNILSPNGLFDADILLSAESPELSADIVQLAMKVFNSYVEKVDFKDTLSDELKDILFRKGASVKAFLPYNTLDQLINNPDNIATESLEPYIDASKNTVKPLGILGPYKKEDKKPKLTLESLANGQLAPEVTDSKITDWLEVTDNPNALKISSLETSLRNKVLRSSIIGGLMGNESSASDDDDESDGLIAERNYAAKSLIELHRDDTIVPEDEALILDLPSESVVPIYVPGDVKRHVGYFVLLDEGHNPISDATAKDYYQTLGKTLAGQQANGATVNSILNDTLLAGGTKDDAAGKIGKHSERQIHEYFSQYVEKQLVTRVKNGLFGSSVEIGENEIFYRVAMSRALKQMKTKILFMPADLVNYKAFKYNHSGIGVSLLQDNKILSGWRTILQMANTRAGIRSAVGETIVNITTDPDDPEPEITANQLLHKMLKMREGDTLDGIHRPDEISRALERAGVKVNFTNTDSLTETKMEITEREKDIAKPDTDFEEELRKRHLAHWGLTPENIDASVGVDFAASVINGNMMMQRKVLTYQKAYEPMITRDLRLRMSGSKFIHDEFNRELEESKIKLKDQNPKDLLKIIIANLKVSLPRYEMTKIERQSEAFNEHMAAVDAYLEVYFNPEWISEFIGSDMQDSVTSMQSAVRSYYGREWIRSNGVMPELEDIFLIDEKSSPINESHLDLIKAMLKGVGRYHKDVMKKDTKFTLELDDIIAKIEDNHGQEEEEEEYQDDNSGGPEEDIDIDNPDGNDDINVDDPNAEGDDGGAPDETPTDDGSSFTL